MKKSPWVNEFLAQRGGNWVKGLELFSAEGFHSFWRKINADFARRSWQIGIYLALMTEVKPARAAPLVFIDCDDETNEMLSTMQSVLARGEIEELHEQIDSFVRRESDGKDRDRKEYFDSLVNAVLFMFSNQFETSRTHAETACDIAMKSTDPEVTGREAYYLRSHLLRITARNRFELEDARKLMLIARSKLELDNEILHDDQRVSSIRFSVEDWSRKIVGALADHFGKRGRPAFPSSLMREYLSFVRDCVSDEFSVLGK